MRRTRTVVLFAFAAVMAACASASSFNSQWKNPDAAAVSLSGKRVLAIVQIRDDSRRREGEDLLAAAITAHGGIGVPSYTLFPSNARQQDEVVAERLAKEAGISGIVMMSMSAHHVVTASERMNAPYWYNEPYYRHTWNAWGYGWNELWRTETLRTELQVTVETRVYSIEQDKLLWTGSSETMNPESSGDVIRQLAKDVAAELERAGVLVR